MQPICDRAIGGTRGMTTFFVPSANLVPGCTCPIFSNSSSKCVVRDFGRKKNVHGHVRRPVHGSHTVAPNIVGVASRQQCSPRTTTSRYGWVWYCRGIHALCYPTRALYGYVASCAKTVVDYIMALFLRPQVPVHASAIIISVPAVAAKQVFMLWVQLMVSCHIFTVSTVVESSNDLVVTWGQHTTAPVFRPSVPSVS
ncbi:hypothetical protein JB92DRAFT_2832449 [Gautieria morchelliformis]|nr:hypothetical protein JB92DRAFT_2832449 [Gautieria morchelliformis]